MKIENAVTIAAPPSTVWNVTTDVERWPQWAPSFESVERLDDGPFQVGSSATIKQVGLPAAKWVVTSLTPGERFSWESHIRGIHFIATHELLPSAAGTQNILRVELSGIMTILLWPLLYLTASRSLKQENEMLKAACESLQRVSAR